MSQPHALIIEDNGKNATILAKLLAKEGVTFTHILDANQVSDVIDSIPQSDIVFVDLEMPGKNGYDILEILRSKPQFQSVPIVTYTVHVSEINTAYQSGFHSFLPKPLDPDRFPDQLARILSGERIWERV
jgi:two-component system cell cycle response regulator DivK